jgi:membrane protease YdiL (CAAX protease family)
MNKKYIIISSLVACIILYFIEQVLGVNYAVKTLSKVVLFMLLPYIYIKLIKKSTLKEELNFRKLNVKHLKLGLLFAISSFLIIIIAYFIVGQYIDFNSIAVELQNKSKITPGNFIFVGSYITFGNSFLEEFFFRGYIFLSLYELKAKRLAYVYSSVLFGVYHMGIFKTWFNLGLIGLALFGLIAVGFIFNWLDTKSENFINSWIVHILADSAIILIGFRMFNIF